MPIEQNGETEKPAKTKSGFTGATLNENSAPSGTMDFLSLSSRVGLQRIDSTIEPYLTKTMEFVKDNLMGSELIRLERSPNSYAVKFNAPDGSLSFFGIQFASPGDPVSQNLYPQSVKLRLIKEELRSRYPGQTIRLADAREIIAGVPADMDRSYEMADTIVRTLQVTSVPEIKNAQIMSLTSNEFSADWSISEGRRIERQLSPHGVPARMDIALTLKAKIKTDMGREFREFDTDYKDFGVIGGYTEIREREAVVVDGRTVMLYRPIFHITVCNAILPLEGAGAVLIAALAPTIYNTLFWARQWGLGDGQPNPGMLNEDPDNRGRPLILKTQEELQEFIREQFAQPVISFQFLDGRDNIPGMWRMASNDPAEKNIFIDRLTNFFATEQENASNADFARQIEVRYEGVYGDPTGILHDSRDIDYLQIAAKNGAGSIDAAMRRILLSETGNPTDRARLVRSVTDTFLPLWLETIALINPDFIKWVVNKTDQRNMVIVDPHSQAESRPFGSFLDGFGSAANVGSIVSNGISRQGLNLSSFWGN